MKVYKEIVHVNEAEKRAAADALYEATGEWLKRNEDRLPLSYWEQTDTLIGAELRLHKAVIELWEVAAGQYLKRLVAWLSRRLNR